MMGRRGMPLTVSRYITESRPGHPTAHADGRVRIHRAVLFDKIGPGAHPCHWCGEEVEWLASGRRELVADHLDEDTWNNDPSNLVPSCFGCNGGRHLRESTHCKWGHEFTPENTYYRTDKYARQCRACAKRRRLERARKIMEENSGA